MRSSLSCLSIALAIVFIATVLPLCSNDSNDSNDNGGSDSDNTVTECTVRPTSVSAGANFYIDYSYRLYNRASTTVRFYQSRDMAISGEDIELSTDFKEGNSSLPTIFGRTGTTNGSQLFEAPSVPGIYYFGLCIDPISEESNTDNNCSSGAALTVTDGSPVKL